MANDYLSHHGVLGQKWGVRRYQNEDGTLTATGKERYSGEGGEERHRKDLQKQLTKAEKKSARHKAYGVVFEDDSLHGKIKPLVKAAKKEREKAKGFDEQRDKIINVAKKSGFDAYKKNVRRSVDLSNAVVTFNDSTYQLTLKNIDPETTDKGRQMAEKMLNYYSNEKFEKIV